VYCDSVDIHCCEFSGVLLFSLWSFLLKYSELTAWLFSYLGCEAKIPADLIQLSSSTVKEQLLGFMSWSIYKGIKFKRNRMNATALVLLGFAPGGEDAELGLMVPDFPS